MLSEKKESKEKNSHQRHSLCASIKKRPSEDITRTSYRQAQGKDLTKVQLCWPRNTGLLASRIVKIQILCLSCLVCGILLWQPESTNKIVLFKPRTISSFLFSLFQLWILKSSEFPRRNNFTQIISRNRRKKRLQG
jgi:hypothetical protein